MTESPCVHLLFGPTGAGKTTYALQFCKDNGAIRFSIDEWMRIHYSGDYTEFPGLDWMWERIERSETQIWKVCEQLLQNKIPVMLDLGFTQKVNRDKFIALAKAANSPYQLHFVTADVELRRARVKERNQKKSGTFEIEVSDDAFAFMEHRFEAPQGFELEQCLVIDTNP